MSRLMLPEAFVQKVILFNSINKKHTADGATSVLGALLTQNGIDLSVDATAVGNAQTHEDSRLLLTKQSGNYHQLSVLKMKTVLEHIRGMVQFLKSFYKANFKAIGEWGATITDTGKIIYPTDVADQITLFTNIQKQHNSYLAGQSPLLAYLSQNNIDLPTDATAAAAAQDYYTKFQNAAKSAEEETQNRDALMDPVFEHVSAIGDFLKKLFNPNTNVGDWGFVVDNSKKKPKLQTSNVKIGAKTGVNGVVIGSTMTNLGTGDLYVFKGKKITTVPIIVHAGEQLGMTKGFSFITVVNPSTLVPGKFKVLVNK